MIAYPVTYIPIRFIKTISNEDVQVKVYNLNGRLIEAVKFDVSEAKNQKLGSNYKSGLYLITVTQGEETRTLKVIKK